MDGNCFDAYLSLCTPFQLSGPWAFVHADAEAFRGPADPAAALATLVASYPDKPLLAAGIAQRNAAGSLQIHPFLSVPEAPIVALRESQQRHRNNLMTEQGCIRGFRYPLFAVLFDKHTYWAIEGGSDELILTDTLEDAIVLRSLGFAAAPIVGLSELDDYGVTLLGTLFGAKRRPSQHGMDRQCAPQRPTPQEQAAAERIYEQRKFLVLPGCHRVGPDAENFVTLAIARWSPKSLSLAEPQSVRVALNYLNDVRRFLNVELFEVNHWTPTSHHLAGINFGVTNGEVGWVKSALFESFDQPNRDLEQLMQADTSPRDLAVAIQKLQQAFFRDSGDSGSRKRCKAAVEAYRAVLERDLLGPMTRQAEQVTDPFLRGVHIQWVDLYTLFTDKMLAIREQMFASLKPDPRNAKADVDKKLTAELLTIHKQLMALAPYIVRCPKNHKPSRKPAEHKANSSSPRFGGLDFVTPN